VVEAWDKNKFELVALKIVKKRNRTEFISLQNEAEILKQLDHPNIVKFRYFNVYEEHGIMGLERVKGDSLGAFLKSKREERDKLVGSI
jgi:serine/threonine protein kinase